MNYVRLGNTGMQVSRLCIGCMSYGMGDWGHHPWVLDEKVGLKFIRQAFDAGINFFDTADFYSLGGSEAVLGKALADLPRDEIVVASKVGLAMSDRPNRIGLSRKHIMQSVDASLLRLKLDHIDLYQIHRLDHDTPMEEMLEALNDVVRAGKALYLGASSMYGWQFMKALGLQRQHGFAPFVSMQNFYNLAYREEEREMMPLCQSEGIAVIPWSPMARGFLARKSDDKLSERAETDKISKGYFGSAQDLAVRDRLHEVAVEMGVKPSQLALAWVLAKPYVTAPIIGATKQHHLPEAVGALDIKLDEATLKRLEEPYVPRAVMGHS